MLEIRYKENKTIRGKLMRLTLDISAEQCCVHGGHWWQKYIVFYVCILSQFDNIFSSFFITNSVRHSVTDELGSGL